MRRVACLVLAGGLLAACTPETQIASKREGDWVLTPPLSDPDLAQATVSAPEPLTGADLSQTTLERALSADAAFAEAVEAAGFASAVDRFVDLEAMRVLVPGRAITGEASIRRHYGSFPDDGVMSWRTEGGYGAASGDLAVTYGRYTFESGAGQVSGRYVTVWRPDETGDLKAHLDIGVAD